MIKNFIPSLAEIGKIKIGIKGKMIQSKGGKDFQPPQKLDHFRVVTMSRGADGNYLPNDEIHKLYGEKPTEIPIRLLFDDLELNFNCRYACYAGKDLWCHGDGETFTRMTKAVSGTPEPEKCPCERQKPDYPGKGKCKINGVLSCIIDGAATVGGVYKFRTTGYNSTVGILSSLTLIKSITGGVLAGIPLSLTVAPKNVINPENGQNQTIYFVNVEYRGGFDALREIGYNTALNRQKHNIRIENIEQEARRAITFQPDMMGDAAETAEEFYPENFTTQPDNSDIAAKVKPVQDYDLPALKEARKVAPEIYDEAVANLPVGVTQEAILQEMNRIIDTPDGK
jgi:hypothetical protein